MQLYSHVVAKMILIAEDNDDDAFAISRTLIKTGVKNPLKRALDGSEVINYFKPDGPFSDRRKYPIPTVFLLDLKMRRIGGLAVLEWMKGQENLRRSTLVIVLSGYYNKENLQRACSLGARSFLIKPCTALDIRNLVRAYPSYWQGVTHQTFPASLGKGAVKGGPSARASL